MSARYQAEQISIDGVPVVRLKDLEADLTASIVPSHGNITFELLHAGQNWLYSPYQNLAQMHGDTRLFGIPLLAPWANRLSSDAYCINGAEYHLNRSLLNLRLDKAGLAIHGLVLFAAWTVGKLEADASGASVTSLLRFTEHPQWLAHYPFAHLLQLTHLIRDGRLHVRLSLQSECKESVPVTIGFHPYFRLPTGNRESWTVFSPAAARLFLSPLHIPTGSTEPINFASGLPLPGQDLDDVFTNLKREPSGDAIFEARDQNSAIRVGFGPRYSFAVIYAPPGKDFFCFEPMSAPTDALHLANQNEWPALQQLPAGGSWSEGFWIEPRMIPSKS